MMKTVFLGVSAAALAIFILSIPSSMISSGAYANKMNGKGMGCSDRYCMGINSPNTARRPSLVSRAFHASQGFEARSFRTGLFACAAIQLSLE
jgi:hypothetical protein